MTEELMKGEGLTFSEALVVVKSGGSIFRKGWNGKGMCVKIQVPDVNSKMSLPYLYIEYSADHPVLPNARCPWLASQTDILACDWNIL